MAPYLASLGSLVVAKIYGFFSVYQGGFSLFKYIYIYIYTYDI